MHSCVFIMHPGRLVVTDVIATYKLYYDGGLGANTDLWSTSLLLISFTNKNWRVLS